jgi:D-alanine-D-alanine ligase
MRVGVLFGGPSPEHDVSILSGLQAVRELARSSKDEPIAIYWTKTGQFFEVDTGLEACAFLDGVPKGAKPLRLAGPGEGGFQRPGGVVGRVREIPLGVVVNACHGGPGEDGTLQGLLDMAGISYTGPSLFGAALGLDKLATTAVARHGGVECLSRELLVGGQEPSFPGPYIVKPRFGGSSIGIDVVADWPAAEARLTANPHLRQGAVIEPYRPDLFDLQIAIISFPKPQLSAVEKPLRKTAGDEILSYRDKYVAGEGMAAAARELPARIPEALEARIRQASLALGVLFSVRGVARLDFLSDGEEKLYFNEINTIPGSLSRYLFVDPPMPFRELLTNLIEEGLTSRTSRHSAAGADGTILRSASSIAAKLS